VKICTVKIVRTLAAVAGLKKRLKPGRKLVLVPTMGALHAGHMALVQRARRLAGEEGIAVVSIFVNPTQFGPKEDFSRYPRTFSQDCLMCRRQRVDAIFHPEPAVIYPEGFSTIVEETRISSGLCGESRPGHFRGVCTVVLKLFNIIQPDIAVFGEKDFQQATIIRRMVADLNVRVKIVVAPTVREPDGLALSSRNTYLSPEERVQAPVIRRALLTARNAKSSHPAALERLVRREIAKAPAAKIDYIEVLDAATLAAPTPATRELVIACAVCFGRTRLIDNIRRKGV